MNNFIKGIMSKHDTDDDVIIGVTKSIQLEALDTITAEGLPAVGTREFGTMLRIMKDLDEKSLINKKIAVEESQELNMAAIAAANVALMSTLTVSEIVERANSQTPSSISMSVAQVADSLPNIDLGEGVLDIGRSEIDLTEVFSDEEIEGFGKVGQ